ncbi:hypothetical protein M569_04429 [Genlisea aurea]|uniref:Bet v I/Major latex protein domain-containing protein n=1 Tax=Genlisea aurea TaxID=192259 RepID=S8E3U1_9LAMI|nr:hypothetical protein M569_04429 [Genlisea aurea]
MASKIEVSVELKSDANKIWESIKESANFFPKALPHQYDSIEVLEGDGKSIGSVRLVKFKNGLSEISTTKEKIVDFDEETKTISYTVIDGSLVNYYNNFKASLSVSSINGESGSSVKWSAEFEKTSEQVPDPELIKGFAVKSFQDLDAFLLANGL